MRPLERSIWNTAIEQAAQMAERRDVMGFVPDYGCFGCFARIADAIRSLKRETASVRDRSAEGGETRSGSTEGKSPAA